MKDCFSNYFLILTLIVFFMLLYVYVGSVRVKKEAFAETRGGNALLNTDQMYVIQGNGVPDKPASKIIFDENDPSVNTVDGTPNTKKSMFVFAYNKCDPKCCDDSPWSCAGGCVCLTEDQKKFLSNRGMNNKFNKCSFDEY